MDAAKKYSETIRRPIAGISAEVMQRLQAHPFPGNMRELENEMRRMVALADDGEFLSVEDLQAGLVVTPRACGICGASHLICAAWALDTAWETEVPRNAILARNLGQIAESLQSQPRAGRRHDAWSGRYCGADFTEPASRPVGGYRSCLPRAVRARLHRRHGAAVGSDCDSDAAVDHRSARRVSQQHHGGGRCIELSAGWAASSETSLARSAWDNPRHVHFV